MPLILFAGEMGIESLVTVRNLFSRVFHLSRTPYRGNERRQSLGASFLVASCKVCLVAFVTIGNYFFQISEFP